MQFVMHLVKIRGKQDAKASKINAFTKNGVDPITRSICIFLKSTHKLSIRHTLKGIEPERAR